MKFLNALNKINGVGSKSMRLLIEHFGTAEKIWTAGMTELQKSGIAPKLIEKIILEKKAIDPEKEWEALLKEKIEIVTITDSRYPSLLKEIANPPYLLYIRGKDDFTMAPMLAVVGSRKITDYGKRAAHQLSLELANAGLTIVSGLAMGVDAMAHRGALDAHGKTIAILGSSLEDKNIGPVMNFDLAQEIIERDGTLVSEYPLNTPANVGTFPARNRLMAGMTLGTLVVEAAEGSGSLITANLALEFNREVFAVPGSVFSEQSQGVNNLIKKGAKVVTGTKDILEELRIETLQQNTAVKKIIPATPEEEKICKILSSAPTHIDTIRKNSKLDTSVVSSTFAVMEMKGMVKNIGGQNYITL